jgi:hypothetical protein
VGILCCTSKYRKVFGLSGKLGAATEDGNALGPWYANVLNIGPNRLLQYMSAKSLLSVVIWRRESRTAEERFRVALQDLLRALAVPQGVVVAELATLAELTYARATDRSVLGSMRDQAVTASYHFDNGRPLLELNLALAETPCGPIGYKFPERYAPALLTEKWRECLSR